MELQEEEEKTFFNRTHDHFLIQYIVYRKEAAKEQGLGWDSLVGHSLYYS